MTATEEIRALLDERGVEWEDHSDENVLHTTWNNMNCWFNEFPDGWTSWGMAMRGTPAQAIEATLGSGECWDSAGSQMAFFSCSACGATIEHKHPRFCFACGRKVVDE